MASEMKPPMTNVSDLKAARERLLQRAENYAGVPAANGLIAELANDLRALLAHIETLEAENTRLREENTRAWTERNTAYAKVKAWEGIVYVERLPLRAVRVEEWGSGEGGHTVVPELTPQKLTDLLDELARLRAALKQEQP